MIDLKIEITDKQAMALAQFLKRAGYSDYRSKSIDDDEAYDMQYAAEKLRNALAEKDFAPR